MSAPIAASAFWRKAGMTYLDYLGACGGAVRNALKEPARSRAQARAGYWFNATVGQHAGSKKSPVSFGNVKK